MSILSIIILGIVVNFICLWISINKSKDPNGPMGMGILFLLAFIPWLFPLLFLLIKVLGFFIDIGE